MVPGTFPGWLLKRAKETGAKRIVTILSPTDDASPCAYLVDLPNGTVEFHMAEDAATGVEAATVTFTRKEAVDFVGRFVGALNGKNAGLVIPGKVDA